MRPVFSILNSEQKQALFIADDNDQLQKMSNATANPNIALVQWAYEHGLPAGPGLFRIAYKLLVNDAAKFSALLIGITFAVFLMVQMTSMFAGILDRSSATVTNVGASMWVMQRSSHQS